MVLQSIFWKDGKILIIDQTKLPDKLEYITLNTLEDVAEAIVNMKVRGAPLIGVTGALGLALVAYKNRNKSFGELIKLLDEAREILEKTRPTAVNLFWALKQVYETAIKTKGNVEKIVSSALSILKNDIVVNKRIADIGSELIEDGDIILTHCNTGSLATVSIGTALGVILEAHKKGKRFKVFITETRPKLQGARLTAFELVTAGLKPYLIVDSAVAYTVKTMGVNKIFVGADRILRDGTTYNKIGTLQLALAAKKFGSKFYVVAPSSTFDLHSNREDIKVEERDPDEVRMIGNKYITVKDINVYNPAFDETSPDMIDAFITEYGIIEKPFEENIINKLSQ